MARLTERPAELILADTMVTRADPVGFTRRLLDWSPGATVLSSVTKTCAAAALVAAGVRGDPGRGADPVAAVAKALLLIGSHRRGGWSRCPPAGRRR